MLKCITIHQPYATLIMLGIKTFETGRSWCPPARYRDEPLWIHASGKVPRQPDLLEKFPEVSGVPLPLGAILGSVRLGDYWRMDSYHGGEEDGYASYDPIMTNQKAPHETKNAPEEQERLGFFLPGTYAWELHDPKPLAKPIFTRGQQGLWNYKGEMP